MSHYTYDIVSEHNCMCNAHLYNNIYCMLNSTQQTSKPSLFYTHVYCIIFITEHVKIYKKIF